MKIQKALILGADGQVGAILGKTFSRGQVVKSDRNPNTKNIKYDIIEILSSYKRLETILIKYTPDVLFLTAGFTWVDGCEKDPVMAYCVNRDASVAVAKVCKDLGIKIVYYSTEYVFDGKSGPYKETDTPNPISIYGRSKLEAEELIQKTDETALIIRTAGVYGPDLYKKNFAYQLHKHLNSNKVKSFMVPVDQISTPTYNRDLAKASILLVENNISGIVNVAGPDKLHRMAFAKILTKHLKGDDKTLKPVSTKKLNQTALRPLNAGLDTSLLNNLLGNNLKMKNINDAANHWIKSRGNLKWKPINK